MESQAMNDQTQGKGRSASHHIKVRHEAPEEQVFVGEDVGLLVHGVIAEVVDHVIVKPYKTSMAEDDGEFTEVPHSMKGVIYGKGEVQKSHFEAFITVGGEEHSFIPHGKFEELTTAEHAAHEAATWKFTFGYSVRPCSCSEK